MLVSVTAKEAGDLIARIRHMRNEEAGTHEVLHQNKQTKIPNQTQTKIQVNSHIYPIFKEFLWGKYNKDA